MEPVQAQTTKTQEREKDADATTGRALCLPKLDCETVVGCGARMSAYAARKHARKGKDARILKVRACQARDVCFVQRGYGHPVCVSALPLRAAPSRALAKGLKLRIPRRKLRHSWASVADVEARWPHPARHLLANALRASF